MRQESELISRIHNNTTLLALLLDNATPNGDCLEWMGQYSNSGYGHKSIMGRKFLIHRLVYLIHNGPLPKGVCVLHKCDNRKCIKYEHLFPGTKKDNAIDMVRKGRQIFQVHPERIARGDRCGSRTHPESRPHLFGEASGMARLTNEDVLKIRELYAQGNMSQARLGKMFGVCQTTIVKVVNRITWSHI